MNLRTQRLQWLRQAALPIRTVDPHDHDFADLEALADHIGDARIVQLGEGSHGSGTDFAAKSRLVAFLHQRMDFQVLVWESGMYDCRRMDRAIRAGVSAKEAARRGIFEIWRNPEATAAIEYARRSHGTAQPLALAGFDCRFSGAASRQQFIADLRAFLGTAGETAAAERAKLLVKDALRAEAKLWRAVNIAVRKRSLLTAECRSREEVWRRLSAWWDAEGKGVAATQHDWIEFDRTVTDLSDLVADGTSGYRGRHSASEREFWRMALGNWRVLGEIAFEKYCWRPSSELGTDGALPKAVQAASWSLREKRNAEVIQFLADRYYRDQKLILWAHNIHVMNAYISPDWNSLTLRAEPAGLTPVGTYLANWYGPGVFSIGFTAHHGRRGATQAVALRPGPVPGDSLEAMCHELGLDQALVPLRGLNDPNHPMRQPLALAVRGYRCEVLSDWSRALDAVVYVDEMIPPARHDQP